MSTAEKRRYTVEEYLELERASAFKHEYYQGEVIPLGRASFAHDQLILNLNRILERQIKDRPCRLLSGKIRVKDLEGALYGYPDVTVVCSDPQFEDNVLDTLLNPKVIVEVLSETTEAYDRGKKIAQYRLIESLEQYVLISQEEYSVEVFTKQDDGQWALSDGQGLNSSIELSVLDCTLALSEIYRRVEIPQQPEKPTND